MLYTVEYEAKINREVNRKLTLFLGLWAVLAGILALFLVLRLQFWATVVTIVCGAPLIFLWSVYLTPPLKYRKLLRDMRQGQQRQSVVSFVRTEDALAREGIVVRPFIVKAQDGQERRLYWDDEMPLPELTAGDLVELVTYGQNIKDITLAQASPRAPDAGTGGSK